MKDLDPSCYLTKTSSTPNIRTQQVDTHMNRLGACRRSYPLQHRSSMQKTNSCKPKTWIVLTSQIVLNKNGEKDAACSISMGWLPAGIAAHVAATLVRQATTLLHEGRSQQATLYRLGVPPPKVRNKTTLEVWSEYQWFSCYFDFESSSATSQLPPARSQMLLMRNGYVSVWAIRIPLSIIINQ